MTAIIIIKSPKKLGTEVTLLFVAITKYSNPMEKYGLILCWLSKKNLPVNLTLPKHLQFLWYLLVTRQ